MTENQCFLILIRPVATSSTPGRTWFKFPVIAGVLLLSNLRTPRADEVPSALPVLAASGCLLKGRFPWLDLLLTLQILSAEKNSTSVLSVAVGKQLCQRSIFQSCQRLYVCRRVNTTIYIVKVPEQRSGASSLEYFGKTPALPQGNLLCIPEALGR